MNNNDIRISILAELAAADDNLHSIQHALNQDPNNWELQAEYDEQQKVCLALEGDLDNWG